LSLQREALERAGCGVLREEKVSGASRKGRSELETLMAFLRSGDTLIVTRIDRLARSMKDLQDIVHELKTKGVALKATEQPIDTSSAAGKAFLDMLGVFAEFETNLRRERQMEGIRKAKAAGVYKGRPVTVNRAAIIKARADGMQPKAIARNFGCALSTVYDTLKQAEISRMQP
jgi:DNA invertase Pin-like site-specific DNA recombinase